MKKTPILLALCLAACASTEQSSQVTPAPPGAGSSAFQTPQLPWTEAFQQKAVLIADLVQIEGPPGLLDHIATRPVAEAHALKTETLPEGFSQVILALDPARGVEIQAVMDQLQLVAVRRLEILERPGDVPVTVTATGDVYYSAGEGQEQRAPSLRLVGNRPR